jgi:hypothetical protein
MMRKVRPSHKQFEARLIQLLRQRFEKSAFRVFDHLKVGALPLEIDVVAVSPKQKWRPDFARFPRLFDYFRRYNVMEIKTEQDRLNIEDLSKFLAYGWLYMAKQRLANVSDITLTALVHHLTHGVKKELPRFGFKPTAKGVYRRDADMVAYVISFVDLPDELTLEELCAFSDPLRRQQIFLSSLGNKEKVPIVEAILDLYESEVKKVMLNIREKSLRNILSAVGTKKVVSALGDKRVVAALGDKKIIAALGDKKIIAALGDERVIAALGDEKIIAALLRNKKLLKSLLAKLDDKELRRMLKEKSYN